MISRREASLLVLTAAAGCAAPDPPPPPLAALEASAMSRRQRPPLRLGTADLEIAPVAAGPAFFVVPPAPIPPAEAMAAMARERLSPVGGSGRARFIIMAARLGRSPSDAGGLFWKATEILECAMHCRLEILSRGGELRGFADADVTRSATAPASTPAERAESAARFVRIAAGDLSEEFDRRVRDSLAAFLAGGGAQARLA
jgi:hypothetical protein